MICLKKVPRPTLFGRLLGLLAGDPGPARNAPQGRADGNVPIRNVNDGEVNSNVYHPDNDNRNLRVCPAAVYTETVWNKHVLRPDVFGECSFILTRYLV
jgi:hypothetical protein